MRLSIASKYIINIAKFKLFGRHCPLILGWAITNRCNLNCIYCNANNVKSPELGTREALCVIDELAEMGTALIAFTGGEPLLRDDMAEIAEHACARNISVNLITNGTLLLEKKNILKHVDFFTLSLDGTREIHDYQRGRDTYDAVIEAVRYLADKGKLTEIAFTLTKYNASQIDQVIELSKEFGALLTCQIVSRHPLGGDIADIVPSKKELSTVYEKLLSEKKGGNRLINHSIRGIRYYLGWPAFKDIECFAGKLFCRIRCDGRVDACSMIEDPAALDCRDSGFGAAFSAAKKMECAGCWCSNLLEFGNAVEFKFDSILNNLKFL
ncbi:MAG: radical SAM protein [Elusimicrobia bacterium]|nr:radical SAM protein [Elusimicrobiota bacterium]